MEQLRFSMWPKRKHSLSSFLQPSTSPNLYGDSWEEQAFAEDAAGILGGCVWPPRSYSCSFCRREFKSAQALGGHMNVHRRDRARLKQSPNTPEDHQDLVQNHQNPNIPNPIPPWDIQYPPRICTMVYNPNPDSDNHVVFAPPSSLSRVSPPPTHGNRSEKTFVPLSSSPIPKEHDKKPSIYASPSWSNLFGDRYFHILDPKNEEKNSKFLASNRPKEDHLSISLNLVVHRTRASSSGGKDEEEEEEEAISCKRRRIDSSTTFPFFPKSNSDDSHEHLQSELVEHSSTSSVEELDLELRLG